MVNDVVMLNLFSSLFIFHVKQTVQITWVACSGCFREDVAVHEEELKSHALTQRNSQL